MPRWFYFAFLATLTVAAAGATLLLVLPAPAPRQRVGPLTPDPIVADLKPVPAFRLVDQEGRPRDETMLDGRVTVIDFIFTHCPYICPGLTGQMSNAARALADTGVQFVSFSVDPARDTPERLRTYAQEHGADLSRWSFLTGDFGTVQRVCLDTLMFELRQDDTRPIEIEEGGTMPNIVHPPKMVLIGPDRRVLRMYDFNIPEDMDALEARARAAAALVGGGTR